MARFVHVAKCLKRQGPSTRSGTRIRSPNPLYYPLEESMEKSKLWRRNRIIPLALVAGTIGAVAVGRQAIASDHQQTPLTELEPRLDVTDVWVFPGSSDDRIVLAATIASPLVGDQAAFFDPNVLYQIKVDNNQDGFEDVVFQFSFDQLANNTQTVDVLGPVAPRRVGQRNDEFPGSTSGLTGGAVRDLFSTTTPAIRRGRLNQVLTANLAASGAASAGQMQVFAGVRDDPFYFDLEQFFRILPDRRNTDGPLSRIGTTRETQGTFTGRASTFRARCNTDASGNFTEGQFTQPAAGSGVFDVSRGCARDFFRGFNALAIIVEVPESQVTQGRGGSERQIGVWATTSK